MKKFLLLGAAVPVLFLAGCGDGWEMKPYHNTPYDGDRTAGTGVEYVRAHMMPEKGPVIKPAAAAPVAPPPPAKTEEKAMNEAEKIFHDVQKK